MERCGAVLCRALPAALCARSPLRCGPAASPLPAPRPGTARHGSARGGGARLGLGTAVQWPAAVCAGSRLVPGERLRAARVRRQRRARLRCPRSLAQWRTRRVAALRERRLQRREQHTGVQQPLCACAAQVSARDASSVRQETSQLRELHGMADSGFWEVRGFASPVTVEILQWAGYLHHICPECMCPAVPPQAAAKHLEEECEVPLSVEGTFYSLLMQQN